MTELQHLKKKVRTADERITVKVVFGSAVFCLSVYVYFRFIYTFVHRMFIKQTYTTTKLWQKYASEYNVSA